MRLKRKALTRAGDLVAKLTLLSEKSNQRAKWVQPILRRIIFRVAHPRHRKQNSLEYDARFGSGIARGRPGIWQSGEAGVRSKC
jgi:hypothetical protein